jgi:hypothetical protein
MQKSGEELEDKQPGMSMLAPVGWLVAVFICTILGVRNTGIIVITVIFLGWLFDFLYELYRNYKRKEKVTHLECGSQTVQRVGKR